MGEERDSEASAPLRLSAADDIKDIPAKSTTVNFLAIWFTSLQHPLCLLLWAPAKGTHASDSSQPGPLCPPGVGPRGSHCSVCQGTEAAPKAYPQRGVGRTRGGDRQTMRTPYCGKRRERGGWDSPCFFTRWDWTFLWEYRAQDCASAWDPLCQLCWTTQGKFLCLSQSRWVQAPLMWKTQVRPSRGQGGQEQAGEQLIPLLERQS